jgi:predicted Zn-dependent protease
LRSDPDAAGLECAPYVLTASSSSTSSVFDNGLPVEPVDWIRDGRLEALISTRHSAQEAGLPVRPAVDNLILEGGPAASGHDIDAMVATTDRGLLLTCLWYIREVDPRNLLLTGLTRDGIYLVEGGEVVGAVNNFRFNESPVGLLGRISEAGASKPTLPREWNDYFTRTAMPPLRIPDFHMSSVSPAE